MVKRRPFRFGGAVFLAHRGLTILIIGLVLFLAVAVYFVNVIVISPASDANYQATAGAKASLTNFDTATLKQAQALSAGADNTSLPAGRTNPFAP